MAERIVVDPVTRIEGHLRIEAEIKDGKIVMPTALVLWLEVSKKL